MNWIFLQLIPFHKFKMILCVFYCRNKFNVEIVEKNHLNRFESIINVWVANKLTIKNKRNFDLQTFGITSVADVLNVKDVWFFTIRVWIDAHCCNLANVQLAFLFIFIIFFSCVHRTQKKKNEVRNHPHLHKEPFKKLLRKISLEIEKIQISVKNPFEMEKFDGKEQKKVKYKFTIKSPNIIEVFSLSRTITFYSN